MNTESTAVTAVAQTDEELITWGGFCTM